jgi:hypothetical protein
MYWFHINEAINPIDVEVGRPAGHRRARQAQALASPTPLSGDATKMVPLVTLRAAPPGPVPDVCPPSTALGRRSQPRMALASRLPTSLLGRRPTGRWKARPA